jgi:hypothetical protein
VVPNETGVQASIEPAGPPILNVTLGSARPVHFASTPVHHLMRHPSNGPSPEVRPIIDPGQEIAST